MANYYKIKFIGISKISSSKLSKSEIKNYCENLVQVGGISPDRVLISEYQGNGELVKEYTWEGYVKKNQIKIKDVLDSIEHGLSLTSGGTLKQFTVISSNHKERDYWSGSIDFQGKKKFSLILERFDEK